MSTDLASTNGATATAVVLREASTEMGLIARANELHRAGVVDQCIELFTIVAKLKAEVMRKREMPWKDFVKKNFAFSLATADNYARIGRTPNALGAVRHLHASGRIGYEKPKPVVVDEDDAAVQRRRVTKLKRDIIRGLNDGTGHLVMGGKTGCELLREGLSPEEIAERFVRAKDIPQTATMEPHSTETQPVEDTTLDLTQGVADIANALIDRLGARRAHEVATLIIFKTEGRHPNHDQDEHEHPEHEAAP